ncbi:DoxX family protein [Parabacteroides sp. PF5-6]|uniref:DoxX family protein n=1 Tax=Parabacteroides sp. PF5-6 TaxID=1742403 RepID=UPI0024072F1E|nr:DoxX family protein [Parabacteroides sp. PF5-6]MDF9829372.1 putative oxidoreductase [Parabacteroides sp. PF5-6]
MLSIIRFLFPNKPDGLGFSLLLFAFRLLFGVLLMSHGIQKWMNFSELSATFPDPLGVGSAVSLGLAIFGEVACSIAFIFGFFYRLVLIPMIFTIAVAFFVIHGADPFAVKELAFIYLIAFVILYIAGPGKFAIDRLIAAAIAKRRQGSFQANLFLF